MYDNDQKVKSVEKVIEAGITASQMQIEDYIKFIILIIIMTLLFLLVMYAFFRFKKKSSLAIKKTAETGVKEIVSGLPVVIKITEKLYVTVYELYTKIKGYLSFEQIETIIDRYVMGFIYYMRCANEIDNVKRQFEFMIEDIRSLLVSDSVFSCYVIESSLMIEILEMIDNKNWSNYDMEKMIKNVLKSAVKESIKESKKVNFIEVQK